MRPLISVVIPAHNPGRYVEPTIRSILRQTMPKSRFEVVFVDDGSDDGTGPRLDRLAREQANVRVIHTSASGGPGRPRNIGLEAALGEYVQFLDSDDELAPRALERLARMALANDSDIVLGKLASETMTRRQDIYARNRGATTLAETPQLADASMVATKLFRTNLLRGNEITFPEGWRQMEDQLFTLRAYLAARVISILGDEPCYYLNKREDDANISAELVDPASHVAHLREIIDEIESTVSDGELRRRLIARFYRIEVLNRLAEPAFLAAPPAYQRELFDALANLGRERFGTASHEGLGAFAHIRSRLLQEGKLEDLVALGKRAEVFTVDARVASASWTNGRLGIEFRAILVRGSDHRPLTLAERDGGTFLDPSFADDLIEPVDVREELGQIRAQVSLIDRQTALEWIVPGGAGLSLRPTGDADDDVRVPTLIGFVEIDPQRVGPGEQPLDDGTWDIQIRWSGLGIQATGPLRLSRKVRTVERPPIAPALLGSPVRWVVPRPDADGAVKLGVGGADRAPARIAEADRRLLRDGSGIAVALPIATDRSGPVANGTFRLQGGNGVFDLPASLRGSVGGLVVRTGHVRGQGVIPEGRYELSAHIGGPDGPALPVGAAIVRADGRVVVLGVRRDSVVTRVRGRVSWTARSLGESARTRSLASFRRMPPWAKDLVRGVYGRVRA